MVIASRAHGFVVSVVIIIVASVVPVISHEMRGRAVIIVVIASEVFRVIASW